MPKELTPTFTVISKACDGDETAISKFYEQVDPANAEILYKQVCEQLEQDDEIKDYAQTYSKMKPKEAAAIFDSMTDNLSLVAKILNAMDAQSRGNILGKMDSATAAKVTKIMNPSQN